MKKLTYLIPLLVVALLLAFAPTPTHAQGVAPEPTTCSHANNEFSGRIVVDVSHDNLPDANEGVPGITVTLSNVQWVTTLLVATITEMVTHPRATPPRKRTLRGRPLGSVRVLRGGITPH